MRKEINDLGFVEPSNVNVTFVFGNPYRKFKKKKCFSLGISHKSLFLGLDNIQRLKKTFCFELYFLFRTIFLMQLHALWFLNICQNIQNSCLPLFFITCYVNVTDCFLCHSRSNHLTFQNCEHFTSIANFHVFPLYTFPSSD